MPPNEKPRRASGIAFEKSAAWRALSAEISAAQSSRLAQQPAADRILPKSRYPHLAMERANLQVQFWTWAAGTTGCGRIDL